MGQSILVVKDNIIQLFASASTVIAGINFALGYLDSTKRCKREEGTFSSSPFSCYCCQMVACVEKSANVIQEIILLKYLGLSLVFDIFP
ncbi:unnamed protein product [Camellia sinensis]